MGSMHEGIVWNIVDYGEIKNNKKETKKSANGEQKKPPSKGSPTKIVPRFHPTINQNNRVKRFFDELDMIQNKANRNNANQYKGYNNFRTKIEAHKDADAENIPPFPSNNPNNRFKNLLDNCNKNRFKKLLDNRNNEPNTNQNKTISTKIHTRADVDVIRKALTVSGKLPKKLRNALGDATLNVELRNGDESYRFVVDKNEHGDRVKTKLLKKILEKNVLPGRLEWLQGKKGWIISTDIDSDSYKKYHRTLHEAYTTVMRSLLKKVDPDLKVQLGVLYYDQGFPTQENCDCPLNRVRQSK